MYTEWYKHDIGPDPAYDYCYFTGNYEDQYCEMCPHKEECSGSGFDPDDDD